MVHPIRVGDNSAGHASTVHEDPASDISVDGRSGDSMDSATSAMYTTLYGHYPIHVRSLDTWQNHQLIVKASYTVRVAKTFLQSVCSIPSNCQLLTYCAHVIDNDETLAYYNIDQSCTLNVSDMRFQCVFIRFPTGFTMGLNIVPSLTVAMVKARVYARTHVSPQLQRLFFGPYALETGRIGDYSIQNKSTIDVHIAHGLPIKSIIRAHT